MCYLIVILLSWLPHMQKGTKAHLHDACLVVDTLGGKSKLELIVLIINENVYHVHVYVYLSLSLSSPSLSHPPTH